VDPTCCDTLWDSGCADIAVFLCEPPADSNWPCPCLGSCFESHDNPGCDNASCCSIVCNISPVCCDDGWDQSCAAFARDACCGPPGCGSGCNLPCLEEHEQPFCDDPYCCEAVCQLDPLCCLSTWDTACVGIALDRCGSACGLSPAGDCFVPHDLPGCDQGRCCAEVCSKDPACCNSGWDDLCVTEAAKTPKCVPTACGDFGAGSPCSPHPNPASELLDCCKEVCTADQYCCQVEWDTTCVDIARDIADCGCGSQCGDACAGSCCEGRDSPSCDDADCCLAVCSNDAYCCAVAWDATCAARARLECNAPGQACPAATCTSGNEKLPDCCVPSNQPFCSGNSACCKAVCAVDPFCCDTAWDVTCAERAGSLAGICKCSSSGGCGDPDAGSCFREHPTPYCADGGCCVAVCQFEPFCCSEEWDSLCVKIAQEICAGGFTDPLRPAGRDGTGKPTAERRRVVPEGWVPARERIQPKRPIPAPPGMPAPRRPVPMTPVDGAGPEGAAPAVAPPATPSKAAKGPAAAKP
jgi:hypothetical protein